MEGGPWCWVVFVSRWRVLVAVFAQCVLCYRLASACGLVSYFSVHEELILLGGLYKWRSAYPLMLVDSVSVVCGASVPEQGVTARTSEYPTCS